MNTQTEATYIDYLWSQNAGDVRAMADDFRSRGFIKLADEHDAIANEISEVDSQLAAATRAERNFGC